MPRLMKRWFALGAFVPLFLALGLQACSPADSPSETDNDAATSAVTAIPAPTATPAPAVSFVEDSSEPFGTFDGVDFVRYTGFFEGETSLGPFRMPYEIIAPEDPASSNGAVLVEPPHFAAGPFGRDRNLGRDLVFQTVSGYATVGFGDNNLTILDPTADDLLLAGEPVENPGTLNFAGTLDEEILIQFSRALKTAPYALEVLGSVGRLYAYGISQTAAILLESQRNLARTSSQGLFDFTLLHTVVWGPPEFGEERQDSHAAYDFLDGEFEPLNNVGKVIIVETEGDLVISEAEQLRRVVGEPDYRLYEVAGADHSPLDENPLDHSAVARAMFVAGDRWVRSGAAPPPSVVIESAAPGEVDPVYGEETGIARDGDLNARGGVRLPDLEVGRAQYIAADPATSMQRLPPAFNILSGSKIDLTCEPEPGSESDEPRFGSHAEYVSAFTEQVNQLQQQGFLLEADVEAMVFRATESDVGEPDECME